LFFLVHELADTSPPNPTIEYGFGYDTASRLTHFTNSAYSDEDATYTYDNRGQLTDADYDVQAAEDYEYDANGNRTDGDYDSTLYNRLATDGTYNYAYDDEGNVIARYEDTSAGNGLDDGDTNITDYVYDHRNRLVSVSTRATYASSPVPVAEYSYDPFDRRIATTYPGTTTRELYVYDNASPSPSGRGQGEGNVLLDFVDADTEDEVAPVLSRRYLDGPALSGAAVDQVLAQEDIDEEGDPIGAVWLLTDHQGTTRDLVAYDTDVADETTVAMHFSYTAYGQPLSGDTSLTRFLYAGLQYEAASGLHFSATRTYDPVTARWNSPDWIGINGGDANFYRYALNSPTNGADPSGQSFWDDYWYFLNNPDKMDRDVRIAQKVAFGVSATAITVASGGIAADIAVAAGADTVVAGTVGGAAAGFVGGVQTGHPVEGAIEGAVGGAVIGTVAGAVGRYGRILVARATSAVTTTLARPAGAAAGDLVAVEVVEESAGAAGNVGINCFIAGTQVVVEDSKASADVRQADNQSVSADRASGKRRWAVAAALAIGTAGQIAFRRRKRRKQADGTTLPDEAAPDPVVHTPHKQPMMTRRVSDHASGGSDRQKVREGVCAPTVCFNAAHSTFRTEMATFQRKMRVASWQSASRRSIVGGWGTSSLLLLAPLFVVALGIAAAGRHDTAPQASDASSQSARPLTTRNIEDIRLGDRVLSANPEVQDEGRTASGPDAANCRRLILRMPMPGESAIEIELLRPREWIEANGAESGHCIQLNLPEMGAHGLAQVLAVRACPTIRPGSGCVVTGTFNHAGAKVIDLSVTGSKEPITCTASHPFWSEDRQSFVEAGQLRPNERLRTVEGRTVSVGRLDQRVVPERVFTLEVSGQHVYYVSQLGVLVHNQSPMTPDQQALSGLVDEVTHGGRKPLSVDDANTVLDWAQEYNYPGWRAGPGDVGGTSPWGPHIHIPGSGYPHIPVAPGVRPR
jgi:RHS repeat-associated protein